MSLRPFYSAMVSLTLALLGTSMVAPVNAATASKTASKKHKHKQAKKLASTQTPQVITSRSSRHRAAQTTSQAALIHTYSTVSTRVSYARRRKHARVFFNPWTEPTYADSTVGDNIDGEDLVIRKAAIDA